MGEIRAIGSQFCKEYLTSVPAEHKTWNMNQNLLLKHKFAIAMRRIVTMDAPGKQFAKYLGLKAEPFRQFLQTILPPEFNTGNYGQLWVLDHIVPIFLFDMTNKQDLHACWNYINVIPMPMMLNRLKGVSTEFSLRELEIRSTWKPSNPFIDELKRRIARFRNSIDGFHSPRGLELPETF